MKREPKFSPYKRPFGLCGVEMLAKALPPLRLAESQFRVAAEEIRAAVQDFPVHRHPNQQAHAIHAAAFCRLGQDHIPREDVGRHNTLDKLAGALAHGSIAAESAFIVLSSRVSIEMVQKAAVMGAPIVGALSAPTALPVRACAAAGSTLIAIGRDDSFEVFTHPERMGGESSWRPRNPARSASAEAVRMPP
jgi:FdhD protein